MEEVSLIIEEQVFKVSKDMLCKHSDYFCAMFSGKFVESYQEEVKINIVDADSMKIILKYMENDSIDLTEYSLDIIGDLAIDATFLQVVELIKQIECHLDTQLSASNFMETMNIAKNVAYKKLLKLSASFGLLSFKDMKADYIPSIDKLYWYLSHPYLHVSNELDIFKLGLDWILHTETGADALLLILCCLDIKKLTSRCQNQKPTAVPRFLYTFNDKKGFEKWLEVSEKDLWSWNSIAWGLTKLVVVCGEVGIGTGRFMKDVQVYDTLRKQWTVHGVELPSRRHGGVAIVGDSLFIIGGIGAHRTVLYAKPIVYDLKLRSYKYIAHFPEPKQCNAVCAHKDVIYTAGQRSIYKYDDTGESDRWVRLIKTQICVGFMISYKEYIYCMQDYSVNLFRVRPGIDTRLESICDFNYPPATLCNVGNRLLYFSRVLCKKTDANVVEEYRGDCSEETPSIVWIQSQPAMMVNDVAGSCALVLDIPKIDVDIPSSEWQIIDLSLSVDFPPALPN
ncbi:kelch-like protein 36 [Aphomia sociella]